VICIKTLSINQIEKVVGLTVEEVLLSDKPLLVVG